MDNPGPIIRRDETSPRIKLILGAIVVSDIILFGFLFYLFDEFGFFQEAWGWPLLAGIAVVAAIQFYVIRRILIRADKAGKLTPNSR